MQIFSTLFYRQSASLVLIAWRFCEQIKCRWEFPRLKTGRQRRRSRDLICVHCWAPSHCWPKLTQDTRIVVRCKSLSVFLYIKERTFSYLWPLSARGSDASEIALNKSHISRANLFALHKSRARQSSQGDIVIKLYYCCSQTPNKYQSGIKAAV